jgi:hypothetical protein
VEFADFFNGCKSAVTDYKKMIEHKYNIRLTGNDWALAAYRSALERGETITPQGKPIQTHIDYIEHDKKFVEGRGYTNNRDFCCKTTEAGDIVGDGMDKKYELYYSDVSELEKAILQAEKELYKQITIHNQTSYENNINNFPQHFAFCSSRTSIRRSFSKSVSRRVSISSRMA